MLSMKNTIVAAAALASLAILTPRTTLAASDYQLRAVTGAGGRITYQFVRVAEPVRVATPVRSNLRLVPFPGGGGRVTHLFVRVPVNTESAPSTPDTAAVGAQSAATPSEAPVRATAAVAMQMVALPGAGGRITYMFVTAPSDAQPRSLAVDGPAKVKPVFTVQSNHGSGITYVNAND